LLVNTAVAQGRIGAGGAAAPAAQTRKDGKGNGAGSTGGSARGGRLPGPGAVSSTPSFANARGGPDSPRGVRESMGATPTSSRIRSKRHSVASSASEDNVDARSSLSNQSVSALDNLTKRLQGAMLAIECQALPTLPSPGSNGVDRKWIHRELGDIAAAMRKVLAAQPFTDRAGERRKKRFEDDPTERKLNRSLSEIVQHIDLDAQQKQWLSSQYTRTGTVGQADVAQPSSGGAKADDGFGAMRRSRSASTDKVVRTSVVPTSMALRVSSIRKSSGLIPGGTEYPGFWFAVPSDATSSAPTISSSSGGKESGLPPHRLAMLHRVKGPFSALQMVACEVGGHLPPEVLILFEEPTEGEEAPGAKARERAAPIAPTGTTDGWQTKADAMPDIIVAAQEWRPSGPWKMLFSATDTGLAQFKSDPILDVISPEARNFRSWNFDLWKVPVAELDVLVAIMFMNFGLFDSFDVDGPTLKRFLNRVDVAMSLHNSPYHNRYHSFDVCHACFVFCSDMDCSDYLTELEVFTLLVAGLCHDLEHPGTNNAYQINAMTDLALRYNDQSPLENHHCAVAWDILRDPACDLFNQLDEVQLRTVRKNFVTCVMATDMTCHFSLKEELDGVILRNAKENQSILKSRGGPASTSAAASISGSGGGSGGSSAAGAGGVESGDTRSSLGKPSELDRCIILKTVLHVADISNPCKPWATSKIWADRVLEEFLQQGDREKAESLPVSPNMDRNTTKQAELSVNFVDFIVGPFFMALTNLLPKVHQCCALMQANRSEWHGRIEEDIMSRDTLTQDQKVEELARWKRRDLAFNEVVAPLIQEAQAQTRASAGVQNKQTRQAKRRSTLRMFEDISQQLERSSIGEGNLRRSDSALPETGEEEE